MPEAGGTPLPAERTPSPASEDDEGKDQDWVPGQRGKKRGHQVAKAAAAGTDAVASAAKKGKRQEKAPVPIPSLLTVAKVKVPQGANRAPPKDKKGVPLPVAAPAMSRKPSTADVTILFPPGTIGLRARESGEVVIVAEHGTADLKGVKVGWLIETVDCVPYSHDVLREKVLGTEYYSVAFDTKAALYGIWNYRGEANEPLSYEIHAVGQRLVYRERNDDGSIFCEGDLETNANYPPGYLVATLRDRTGLDVGMIRLFHKPEVQQMISNFKTVSSSRWQKDTLARKEVPEAAVPQVERVMVVKAKGKAQARR